MNKKAKVLYLSLLLIIISIASCTSLNTTIQEKANYLEKYRTISPESCPNTKWICVEKNIYFFSDENGLTLGVANVGSNSVYFDIHFSPDQFGPNASNVEVAEISSLSYSAGIAMHRFYGHADFYDDRCVIFCQTSGDEASFWGLEDENATLTFIKEDISKAVKYDP